MSESNNDEIDLQELAIRTVRYFNQHFKFIFLSSVFGIALGITGYILLPPIYESEMIVMSDILTESYSDRLTESLDRLIKEDNDTTLASRLALDVQEARSINAIKIESVKKESGTEKAESSTFIITAEVKAKTLLPKLQEGLITYLRSNEFVKTRVRQREETYRLTIDNIGKEIKSLDSLKARLFQGKPIYSNASEIMLMDPTSIYSKVLDLKRQQIELRNALELFNSIQLIEGFTPFRKPASPKLSIMLLAGFALGFFGSLGILTFTKLWKMSKSASKPLP